jgi:hypothetical protein
VAPEAGPVIGYLQVWHLWKLWIKLRMAIPAGHEIPVDRVFKE